MMFYGIASLLSHDIEHFSSSQEDAEEILAGILADEPDFEGALWVAVIEFEESLN